MKAAAVVANEDVQYQEVEEPQAKPGWVKIKVKASGICGSDVPRVLNHGVHFYPIVLGHEFSGDVVEVGEGVTKVKVGDRVSGAPLLPCMKCDDCQNGNFSPISTASASWQWQAAELIPRWRASDSCRSPVFPWH